jgi:hypothetical protein
MSKARVEARREARRLAEERERPGLRGWLLRHPNTFLAVKTVGAFLLAVAGGGNYDRRRRDRRKTDRSDGQG